MPKTGHATRSDVTERRLFRIATAFTHRRRLRVDTAGDHTYRHLHTFPTDLRDTRRPTHPWAIELFDTRGRLRLIGIDFDTKLDQPTHPGDDTADFIACLTHLGIPALLSASSPGTGRRHVWIPCPESGLPAAETTALRHLLAARYPSVDTAPLANRRTGALRFPGSPHRGGGTAQLLAVITPPNADATAVLTGACRAPADIAARIAAHFAVTDTPTHLTSRYRPGQPIDTDLRQQLTAVDPTRSRARGWVVDDADTLDVAVADAARILHRSRYHLSPVVDDRTLPHLPCTLTDLADHLPHRRAARRNPSPTTPVDSTPARTTPATPPVAGHPLGVPTTPPIGAHATQVAHQASALADDVAATVAEPHRRRHLGERIDRLWSANDVARAETLGLRAALDALPEHALLLLNPAAPPLPDNVDASGVERSVLLSCAHAGWDCDTVTQFDDVFAPAAFTHSHSVRTPGGGGRTQRSAAAAATHVLRQFQRAAATLNAYTPTLRHPVPQHVAEHAAAILIWADNHHLTYRLDTHLLRRVLEAHLVCALTGDDSYYASTRDLARLASVASPQTAATYTRHLIDLDLITLHTPATGRRAHRFELCRPPASGSSWTQRVPGPPTAPGWNPTQPGLAPPSLRSLLQKRLGLFSHDVWTQPGGTALSAVFAAMATTGATDPIAVAASSGLTVHGVHDAQQTLVDLGLCDDTGNPQISAPRFVAAAQKTGRVGAWHRIRTRWAIQRARWGWWQAECELLTAPKPHKHRVWTSTELDTLGRYPRTADPTHPDRFIPDHAAAYRQLASTHTPTGWVAQ